MKGRPTSCEAGIKKVFFGPIWRTPASLVLALLTSPSLTLWCIEDREFMAPQVCELTKSGAGDPVKLIAP